MKSRRKAREAALQALYQCDTLNEWDPGCVDTYFAVFQPNITPSAPQNGVEPVVESVSAKANSEADDSIEVSVSQEHLAFSRELVDGVAHFLGFIDEQISSASTRWSVKRMSRVDRNIIRLAGFEIAFRDDIPVSVSINEAIEIAKIFGTDDSPMFVNGVLDQMASLLRGMPEVKDKAERQCGPLKTQSAA